MSNNGERLLKVILSPHVSEKSTIIGEKYKQITFKVARDANKCEIKQAVEKLFNVKVSAVRVTNVKAKMKRFRQQIGERNAWKKAYVTLQEGYDIDFSGI